MLTQTAAYLPGLARSLNNLADMVESLGQVPEAKGVRQESAGQGLP